MSRKRELWGEFVKENLIITSNEDEFTQSAVLYRAFKDWFIEKMCTDVFKRWFVEERVPSSTNFYETLRLRGIRRIKKGLWACKLKQQL